MTTKRKLNFPDSFRDMLCLRVVVVAEAETPTLLRSPSSSRSVLFRNLLSLARRTAFVAVGVVDLYLIVLHFANSSTRRNSLRLGGSWCEARVFPEAMSRDSGSTN